MDLPDSNDLIPVYHVRNTAHINIVIDIKGNFKSAKLLKKDKFIIPATEDSASRAGKTIAPHPLADKIQYVAGDYKVCGNISDTTNKYHSAYLDLLSKWANSDHSHQKVNAIYSYVQKGNVVKNLLEAKILISDSNHELLRLKKIKGVSRGESKLQRLDNDQVVNNAHYKDTIFAMLSPNETTQIIDQGSALAIWSVFCPGDPSEETWLDKTLYDSWVHCYSKLDSKKGYCFICGSHTDVALKHPKGANPFANNAKLISSNDDKGFTFLGRFIDSTGLQNVAIDTVVSQKAHNVLRWLIDRQGIRSEKQVTVAWAVSAKPLPQPLDDSFNYFRDDASLELIESAAETEEELACAKDLSTDLGQNAALKLKLILKGYRQQLSDMDQLSIITLDAATPGRMSISYYRECLPDEYFNALNDWYEHFSWYMRQSEEVESAGKKRKKREIWPVIAPSPYAIAQAAYGRTLTDSLKKQTYMRLLPCVVEGRSFPWDFVKMAFQRACNPHAVDHWEWQRNIGVACALYRGFYSRHPKLNQRRIYTVGLDKNKCSRDYLFGRLLAVAERTEEIALNVAGEKRSTTAERYIQQFANNPYQTWRNIELSLTPSKSRLRNNRGAFLAKMENNFNEIMNLFDPDEFTSNAKLSGEFLLGYHCQKMALKNDHTTKTEVTGGDDELNKKD